MDVPLIMIAQILPILDAIWQLICAPLVMMIANVLISLAKSDATLGYVEVVILMLIALSMLKFV